MVYSDSQNRTETTVQFNFDATSLTNGKMVMEIYEGFTFNNFHMNDYVNANVTTHTPYPHQKEFDKHKFRDVMVGNVLLAGTKRADGTVKADDSLRLTADNLGKDLMRKVMSHYMFVATGYNGVGPGSWSVPTSSAGYPGPILPCYGTGQITILLLTHYFDDDAAIPTSNFTLQYRLIAYKETGSASLSRDFHTYTNINYTNEDGVSPAIKRSGRLFYLNRKLSYKPPANCIGYALEFKQVKPTTGLGNESNLVCTIEQERT